MLANNARLNTLFFCLCIITASVIVSLFTSDELKRNLLYLYAYILILGQIFLRKYFTWTLIGVFLLIVAAETFFTSLFRATALCVDRPYGIIADNPNPTSAVLLLGSVWFIVRKQYWAIPLLAILPFIGSRATILASIPILGLLSLIHPATMLKIGLGSIAVAILIFLSIDTLCKPLNTNDISLNRTISVLNPSLLNNHVVEAKERVESPFSLIPRGELYSDRNMPIHSVPFRYAYTYGIASMLAWVVVMLICLTYNIGSKSWWLVLTIFGLSWLDYYFIEPYFLLPLTWLIFIKHLDTNKEGKNEQQTNFAIS